MLRRTLLSTLLAGSASLAYWSAPARAQDAAAAYPDKPVMIIVPFAAGGNTDAFARLVGQELDTALAQRFVVENKAGAGGNIGVGQLARSDERAVIRQTCAHRYLDASRGRAVHGQDGHKDESCAV